MVDDSEERALLRRRRRKRAEAAEYKVGYAKPDRRHQFQPGNSMGSRPRMRKAGESHEEIVNRVANQKVSINVRGRKMRMTKHEVAVESLANDAARGDHKSRKLWLEERAKAGRIRPYDDRHYEQQHAAATEVRRRIEEMAVRLRTTQGFDSPAQETGKSAEPIRPGVQNSDGDV